MMTGYQMIMKKDTCNSLSTGGARPEKKFKGWTISIVKVSSSTLFS